MTAAQVRQHWVQTPQGKLYAEDWTPLATHGAPFILLHDSLGCVALWRDFPERLAQATGRRVIAYDRLGFGRSDAHPGQLTADFVQAEAHEGFAAVCAQLGVEDFVVFGHSVGGGMAVNCAAAYAAQCQGLITESAQAFVEALTLEGIRAADQQFRDPGQMQRLARYHGDKAHWVLRAWVDNWLSEAFAAWSLDAQLPNVRCPVLSLHGELDEFGSPAHPQRITDLVAGPSILRLLQGCGHVPHREQPAVVLEAIGQFLA